MALEAHLQSLTRRHQELDLALSSELKRPSADEKRLSDLKRRKLQIKDQMAAVERQKHSSS
ncbi:MAG: DUF465 domain-containing protein [Pseudomonadota bacterium]